jgi:hypothetical protein
MTWKNWGDHPIVVTINVLAGLAGIIALGYTVFSPSSSQPSAKDNVPSNVTSITDNKPNNATTTNQRDSMPRSISTPTVPPPNVTDSPKVPSLPSEKPTKTSPQIIQNLGNCGTAQTQINGGSHNQVNNNVSSDKQCSDNNGVDR